jgi:tetratricopeptide (TPR) repeat protein
MWATPIKFLLICVVVIFCAQFHFSETWQEYYQKADKALISGEYQTAISLYLRGMNNANKKYTIKIWDDLGFSYFQTKKFKHAISYLEKSVSAFPENFNSKLYLAACYYFNKSPKKANLLLKEIEKNVYFDDKWIVETDGTKIINEYGDEMSHDHIERLKREIGVYINRQKKSDALCVYIDAFNENNIEAFNYLKKCVLNQLGNNSIEIEKMTSMIQHKLYDHINNNLIWFTLQDSINILKKGDIDSAIHKLEEGLLINEKSYAINYNLALIHFDLYKLDDLRVEELNIAEKYCARAIWYRDFLLIHSDYIGAYDLMGNIYFSKKEYKKSLREYKTILEINPNDPAAHYNLGFVYYTLKDLSKAEVEWKKSLENSNELIEELKKSKSNKEKLDHSITVKKLEISYQAYLALGKLYFDQGFKDKAIPELEMAAFIRPNKAEPHYKLALSYLASENIKKAIYHLEKYIYLGGDKSNEAKALLQKLIK